MVFEQDGEGSQEEPIYRLESIGVLWVINCGYQVLRGIEEKARGLLLSRSCLSAQIRDGADKGP